MKNIEDHKSKILLFYQTRHRMPSYSEVMKLTGYRSKNAVFRLVDKLDAEGFITKDKQGKMIPRFLYQGIRMLGLVEAGFPSAAEEDVGDSMTLDEYLIENKEASYLLRVKGDSMIDASIKEGDMVIAERTDKVREGDIVIAEVDGAWTMKYYRMKDGRAYLEAANKKYKPIFPHEELKVAAVVKGVIRKY